MNPIVLIKNDGKRIMVDLNRVIMFEEVADGAVMTIETGASFRLSNPFDKIMKADEDGTETTPKE
jgi:hypothetical protein